MIGTRPRSRARGRGGAVTTEYLQPSARAIHPSAVAVLGLSHTRVPYTNITGRTITKAEIFYANWSYNAATEFSPTSTLTVRAGIEYPVGTMTPLLNASGGRDITITGGSVGQALKASGLSIPNGAVFYIRTKCLSAGGDGNLPRNYTNGSTWEGGTIQSFTAAADDGQDYTTSGTQPTNAGAGYGPYAVCSRSASNKSRSFALFGDSIMRGNISGGVSYGEVGAQGAGYGYINFAFSGGQIQTGPNNNPVRRMALMQAMEIKDAIIGYPVNDLSAGRSVAQIQGNYTTLWTNLRASGIQRIIQATCTPYTTDATDPGTANPSPAGAFTGGASSFRSQVNAWFRTVAGTGNPNPNFVFEFADALESSRDSGLWLNPTVNTVEGLHPTATGNTTGGNALTTRLGVLGY